MLIIIADQASFTVRQFTASEQMNHVGKCLEFFISNRTIVYSLNISLEREESVVPLTGGVYPEPAQDFETCLVVFFYNSQEEQMAKSFIRKFSEDRVREIYLSSVTDVTPSTPSVYYL